MSYYIQPQIQNGDSTEDIIFISDGIHIKGTNKNLTNYLKDLKNNIPSKLSDLENDNNFITAAQIDEWYGTEPTGTSEFGGNTVDLFNSVSFSKKAEYSDYEATVNSVANTDLYMTIVAET